MIIYNRKTIVAMKIMMRVIPVLLATLIITGCSKRDVTSSGKASTTTGWEYNTPENGGFEVQPAVEQEAGPGQVLIEDSNGNSVKLETSGITVNASAKVTINASMVEISASMVTVNAGISKFSGVVQADTVISNSVVSASYTPGAGNIW